MWAHEDMSGEGVTNGFFDGMGVLDFITNFLKGGKNAGRVKSRVSGGHEPERRILHTVSAICEQALSDFGGIRVLASACTDERGRDTGPLSSDPVCRESQALMVLNSLVWGAVLSLFVFPLLRKVLK